MSHAGAVIRKMSDIFLRGKMEQKKDFIQGAWECRSSHEVLTLYHGSKSGIYGPIAPASRIHCDFGKGFYMGTDRTQPLTLICNYPKAKIYTLSVDLSGLRILDLQVGLDWAMLVAFNRGKMDWAKGLPVYRKFESWNKECDMVIGPIADDRMFVVLDRFFNGDITDLAVIHSLSALNLGKQYVACTQTACKRVKIVDQQELSEEDRQQLKYESMSNRQKGIALANDICRKYRREGRFFDEIINEER